MRRFSFFCALVLLAACGGDGHDANDRWVHSLEIHGIKQVQSDEAVDGLAIQPTPWWPFATKKYLDRSALDVDAQRIQAYYNEHGFFDVLVRGPTVYDRDNKSVDIVYEVSEGKATKVTAITIDGLDDIPERDKIKALAKVKIGERFDHGAYQLGRVAMKEALEELGYAYAKVDGEVLVDRPKYSAVLHYTVTPGPLVHFGKITIHGSEPVKPRDLQRQLLFKEGDVYAPEKISKTQTRLYSLGTSSEVLIQLPKKATEPADVDIAIVPSKLRELRLSFGLGLQDRQQEIHARLQWNFLNFFGGLRKLSLKLEPAYVFIPAVWQVQRSGPAGTLEARFTQPDVFHSRIDFFALAGFDLGIQEGFQYYGPRFQLGGERAFLTDHLRVGGSYSLQYLTFFNINQTEFSAALTPLGLGFRNPYRLAWFEEFISVDYRDDRLDTHKGIYAELRTEQGFTLIGSQFSYVKFKPELRGYIPLGHRVTIGLRGTFGILAAKTPADSPVTRRFYLGGPASHRGFSIGRLAPQLYDNFTRQNIPVGGNDMLLLSADVRVRVLKIGGYWLGLVTSLDAGDVVGEIKQLNLKDLHYALGEAVAYETPVGVISAGVGYRLNRLNVNESDYRPNPDPGEPFAFHLTIGASF